MSLWASFPSPEVNALGKTSVPTRLTWAVNTEFAIAALRPSIAQRGSERAPTVATGLKTISAPFRAKACQLSGWWRP